MEYPITVLPMGRVVFARDGEDLLSVLRTAGLAPDAPCGGTGTCGKCTVFVEGQAVCACKTRVSGAMTVTIPATKEETILTAGIFVSPARGKGFALAFDIGTTTVAGFLLDGAAGKELAALARPNPQGSFGADVISRIRAALDGHMQALTDQIRDCVEELAQSLCQSADVAPTAIKTVSLVGNPAMVQLFLGICPENLAKLPFAPVLTRAACEPAHIYIPSLREAKLQIVPHISGFIGSDTVACVLATQLHTLKEPALLVDIGTNGEMVMTDGKRLVACSTAAGPALEGAMIRWGMRAAPGAIDHVFLLDGMARCTTVGGEAPVGICGSGIVDAVAAALEMKKLDRRGKLLEGCDLPLAGQVVLTQEDIRQVQLAKGAIAAGIELMAKRLELDVAQLRHVYLAGAFGSFLQPQSACRIGLLPNVPEDRILAVGNAAGSGAKLLALEGNALAKTEKLVQSIECLELAAQQAFPRCFAKHMCFLEA